jgi:hypothetical protein
MLKLLVFLSAFVVAAPADKPLKPDLSLISTWEQVKDQEPFPPPYMAVYRRGNKELRFIASLHGSDPATFALIRDQFASPPQVLVIEGVGSDQGLSPASEVDIMDRMGWYARSEGFYALNLALRHGLPFIGGEPADLDYARAAVAAGFSLKDLQGIQTLGALIGGPGRIRDDEPTIEGTLEDYRLKFAIPAEAALPGRAGFLAWVKERFGDTLDMAHLSRYQGAYAVGPFHLKFSEKLDRFRESHIVGVITDMLNKYDKVLVVYGAGHHMGELAVLTDMLASPEYVFSRGYSGQPPSVPGERLQVEAYIDGAAELHLGKEGFYWVEGDSAKPGRHGGRNEPTYVNGEKWLPVWGKPGEGGPDRSQPYPFKFASPCYDLEIPSISTEQGVPGRDVRDPVTVRCLKDEQVLFIPDTQEGARWYTLRLFRAR